MYPYGNSGRQRVRRLSLVRQRISPLDDDLRVLADEVVLAEDEERPSVGLAHAG